LRGTGAFDGCIDLGGIQVKVVSKLEIRRPFFLEGKFEEDDEIERPEHT